MSAEPTSTIWTKRVLSADDLRGRLEGEGRREWIVSPKTIVTPLALDELRSKGIKLIRQETAKVEAMKADWGVAEEIASPLVKSAIEALARDGIKLTDLGIRTGSLAAWIRSVSRDVSLVLFSSDSALAACIANKLPGKRAAAVASVQQTAKALATLGANVLAVEMPGRTFFEIRQILRTAAASKPSCPAELAGLEAETCGSRK